MGKNDRLSRDQKRKTKLKKRAERSHSHESLAYHGKKYRAEEFVPFQYRTEVGIYEAYVMSEYQLTDDEVESALGRLIVQMRQGPLPPFGEKDKFSLNDDQEELVLWCVRRNWQIKSEEGGPGIGRDDLIGVLRSILGSLEIWRSQNMHPQGFLIFLEGFMKKTGVSVHMVKTLQGPVSQPEIEDATG